MTIAPVTRKSNARRWSAAAALALAINVLTVAALNNMSSPSEQPKPRVEELFVVDLESPDEDSTADETQPAEVAKREELRKPDPRVREPVVPEKPDDETTAPEPEETKPEAEPEPPPPEPEPAQPVPAMPKVLDQMKMVEQLDEVHEKDAPADANYLSNVNRNVREETRAEQTNLEQDAAKVQNSQLEPAQEKAAGNAAQHQVARLKDEKSPLADKKEGEKKPKQATLPPPPLLSMQRMREFAQTQEEQNKQDALARESAAGEVLAAREARAKVDGAAQPSQQPAVIDPRRLMPTREELRATVNSGDGGKAIATAQAASRKPGVWDQARERYQSPLENMVPEVKVGNQTALRSRAHPFARFIATMHRQIHELWAYGFMERWDRSAGSSFNNYALWSRVEIVITADGKIEKVSTVHFSGNGAFDAAARDVVWSAGPYPEPPAEIRSGNGKVYVHWSFHRDERACGTFGAQPFILDNAGQGERPDAHAEVRPGSGMGEHAHAHGEGAHKPAATGPLGPARPAAPTQAAANPPSPTAPSPTAPSPAAPGLPSGLQQVEPLNQPEASLDPKARATARTWLSDLARGQVTRAIGWVRLPFAAGDGPPISKMSVLRVHLTDLARELAGQPIGTVETLSASALMKRMGGLPAGIEPGPERAFAVAQVGPDWIIVMMERVAGVWRVVGLSRG